MQVSIFITCLIDTMFPDVAESLVRLLQRQGIQVQVPRGQTCCGQPAFNSGYWEEAREVAKTWINAFSDSDYIVSPSGSCGAMIHHNYPMLFKDDPKRLALIEKLKARTFDWTQFFVDILQVEDLGASANVRATYHPSCHATRLLELHNAPQRLLQHVRGLTLVDLPFAEQCCGFGGTFSVKVPAISTAMATDKVTHIAKTQAQVVLGLDMGCLMNIAGRMKHMQMEIPTMHLAQFLDRATSGVPILEKAGDRI
ncbi:(Fe-S)-binding protein [Sulfoacidibacillus thermotolerans]|uniref:Fe-S oxidoreductase n=1 Tax=Sulfoacidibacillus thermotolerans TaxID=1765684 RepID=A0A2U3DBT9_SULT2|nr:(Fe-S)-binding protein [Sulfoacidibacillus thermotolerans]PWI58722.1 Fe-S oxidoreductase [Sulfoacidibacillus thermotolerans]